MNEPNGRRAWLDNRRNIDRIVWSIYAICAALFLADWFVPKHGPFAVEHWFGFYGVYAFIACVGLVFAAREIRRIVMRSEEYYDDE